MYVHLRRVISIHNPEFEVSRHRTQNSFLLTKKVRKQARQPASQPGAQGARLQFDASRIKHFVALSEAMTLRSPDCC